MNNKFWFVLIVTFHLVTACGGGGGSIVLILVLQAVLLNQLLTNLISANACKKAWYTAMPTASSSKPPVFNNYSFFWQQTSFENMPVCENYYESTTAIIVQVEYLGKLILMNLLNIQKIFGPDSSC